MEHDVFDLSGQVVLFVGAGGGIGREVALGLAHQGADVAVADISSEAALRVAEEIQAAGRRATAITGDITSADDCQRMVAQTVAALGPLDILVNAVGFNIFANLTDLTPEDWNRVLAVNLTGAYLISTAAARAMAAGGGRIINFASVTALRGSPGQAAYAAAKAGLINLTKSMALEWAPKGIRVNAISPVMTETPINAGWLAADPGRKAAIAKRIPAGRLGTPGDFVGPVIFLASSASSFRLWPDTLRGWRHFGHSSAHRRQLVCRVNTASRSPWSAPVAWAARWAGWSLPPLTPRSG